MSGPEEIVFTSRSLVREKIGNFLRYALAGRKKIGIEANVIRFESPNGVALENLLVFLTYQVFFPSRMTGKGSRGIAKSPFFT